MKRFRTIMRRMLPPPIRIFLQRLYYPRVIRGMSPDVWPPSRIVRSLLNRGDLVVDAGANIGYVTYWLSQWVGETGEVHSFEPVPQTFAFLEHNVAKLGLRNVRLYRAAVTSRLGDVSLEIPNWMGESAANLYEARVVDADHSGRRMVTAPALTLDHVFKTTNRPVSFIKLDVEGHELSALRGARHIIEKWKPALAIEVSALTAGAVFDELRELGYTAYQPQGLALRLASGPSALTDGLFLQKGHLLDLQARGVTLCH